MTITPRLSEEVEAALRARGPVVALETTLVSHGFPGEQGVQVGKAGRDKALRQGCLQRGAQEGRPHGKMGVRPRFMRPRRPHMVKREDEAAAGGSRQRPRQALVLERRSPRWMRSRPIKRL